MSHQSGLYPETNLSYDPPPLLSNLGGYRIDPPAPKPIDEGEGATHSILEEAHQLTHGDRNKSYGHPYEDYTCTAALMSAVLASKLKEPLTAHEAALMMCCVKLSRESRVPKRDNLIDLAGYAWVAQVCRVEQGKQPVQTKGDIVK